MSKVRKMLGNAESPHILALMNQIDTQSKATLVKWGVSYVEKNILPIYLAHCKNDDRLVNALDGAKKWLEGNCDMAQIKLLVAEAYAVAKELDNDPIAQASSRAIGQAVAIIQRPSHALSIAFYGSASIAYDKYGLSQSAEYYDDVAKEVGDDLLSELKKISVQDEKDKVKIKWNC